MPLLSTRVTIAYKDKPPVLRDLCLQLGSGEVLGLVGHSGCYLCPERVSKANDEGTLLVPKKWIANN